MKRDMKCKIKQINDELRKIKNKERTGESNYYFNLSDPDETYETVIADHTIVWLRQRVKRKDLYYYTADTDELRDILKDMPSDCVINIITKDLDHDISVFEEAGFCLYETYERYGERIYDINQQMEIMKENKMDRLYNEKFGTLASRSDRPEIQRILYESFDPVDDDLLTDKELDDYIDDGCVLVERDNKGQIYCIYIYHIQGKKLYGHILFNKGMGNVSYSIEKKVILDSIAKYGVNYKYYWIRRSNKSAKKRMNLTSEGVYNLILSKEKKKHA